jgi:hypothetical protein
MCVSAQTVTPASGTYELSFSLDKHLSTLESGQQPPCSAVCNFPRMAEERGRDVRAQKIPTLKHSLVQLVEKKTTVRLFIPGLSLVAQASGEQKA